MRSILVICALCAVMSLSACSRGRDRCCEPYETDHGYSVMRDRQECGQHQYRPVILPRDYYDDEYRGAGFRHHRGDYYGWRDDDRRYYRDYQAGYRDYDSCDRHRRASRPRYRDYDDSVSERYIPPISSDAVNYEE